MDKFIDVADVQEDDEVQITVTYTDGAEAITTGRVRRDYSVWDGGSELRLGAEYIAKLPTAQAIKDYTIELLRRDEKHGYYLATLKDTEDLPVYLWEYDGKWKIVTSTRDGDFVADRSERNEPSEHRYFIGTELP